MAPSSEPQLPTDERLRCICTRRPNDPERTTDGPRCGWQATSEDQHCDGCRTFCVRGLPIHFEPSADTWARLMSGQPYTGMTAHLVGSPPSS